MKYFIDNGSKDNNAFKLKDICQKNNFIFLIIKTQRDMEMVILKQLES